jgi:hypothetical protein
MFPLKKGLFPHFGGTKLFNGDNYLQAFLAFVSPVSPVLNRYPEESQALNPEKR